MDLMGELVLARNQVLQVLKSPDEARMLAAQNAAQRLSLVTSDLQEQVMKARMQPIERVTEKIPRMVRDLCQTTGKRVETEIIGASTEIDKVLVDAIRDPLMHIIRNSVDHGIEPPEARAAAGKPETGRLRLRASHQDGMVLLQIDDDGAGINRARVKAKAINVGIVSQAEADRLSDRETLELIFRPGFSTAAQVTSLSGRGVGMDVVRTQIEKVGGHVEVESVEGAGTTLRLKLPLTLAIVPALLVRCGGQHFAIPQANLCEIVHLGPSEVARAVHEVGGSPVFRLRGELLPLLRLSDVLEVPSEGAGDGELDVVVVAAGMRRYGLVVDAVRDSEEIVIKPLEGPPKRIGVYAGVTVLGDGEIALILDVGGIAARSAIDVSRLSSQDRAAPLTGAAVSAVSHLVFLAGSGQQCAVPVAGVARLEQIRRSSVETIGGREVVQYRGALLPLVRPERAVDLGEPPADVDDQQLIVFDFGQSVGMTANAIVDIVDIPLPASTPNSGAAFTLGEAVVFGRATLILDVYAIVRHLAPHIAQERRISRAPRSRVLLADDSNAMRAAISGYLRSAGLEVEEARNGELALRELRATEGGGYRAVITDVEMDGLDGFGLLTEVRRRWPQLPVILWTYHDDPLVAERARSSGAKACVNKLRREDLVAALADVGIGLEHSEV
jgi:two-component system chemotaxis sensor kinase CheA